MTRRRAPPHILRSLPGCLAVLAWLVVLLPPAAGAGTEEFSTFDVFAQEEDDESLIDHLLTRPPVAWRDEWERAPQALRTSQGCLTSAQWFIATELKLRAPLGERARFGLDARENESDRASFTYFDFSFRFPTARGTPGVMFRPMHDKSRQDLALFWETGAESSAVRVRATFTFEDVFNDLWAFRQTRVGQASEPYERHPFEPALELQFRRPTWRLDLGAQYLTPSRKRLTVDPLTGVTPRATLWGALGRAALEARVLGCDWRAAADNRQARSAETLAGSAALYGGDFRRQWSAEMAVRRSWTPSLELEAGWLYQGRDQATDPPYPARALDAVDRVAQIEARYAVAGTWRVRLGALHDRITVGRTGADFPSYGTRVESRAYVGFSARFGQVSVDAVEGIELDPEPYEVWWAHDKAFLHLQTAF